MNVNFGLFPPLAATTSFDPEGRKFGRGSAKNLARKSALSQRALNDLDRWIGGLARAPSAAAE
jgi:methylenetetrahydrofolate--tRNA-(uracil-5-)-methyltransferase